MIVFNLKLVTCCALFALLALYPNSTLAAQDFSVSPLLIERETEGRDMFERTITLTSPEDRTVRVYASVHEVTMGADSEIEAFLPASMSNRATSITSWIEITRGRLEIPPGESLTVPLTVKIHPDAPPGTYYAYIGFASGRNRDEIEKTIMSGGGTGTILKLAIATDVSEQLQLVSFTTDRITLSPNAGELSFVVENTGDTAVTPEGEVIIYDTRGKELVNVIVNTDGNVVNPGERVLFTERLPFTERIGRNKAYLTMTYGNNQAAVYDTAFYYSIPWYYVALFFSALVLCALTLALSLRHILNRRAGVYEADVHDLPMFVRQSNDHENYDHDINLKHVSRD